MSEIVKDKLAFTVEDRGYRIEAWYLSEPKGEASVEITKDGAVVKSFLWPAYKIWNISAHAEDIVDGLEQGASDGLYVAGSDGLGGNVYSEPAAALPPAYEGHVWGCGPSAEGGWRCMPGCPTVPVVPPAAPPPGTPAEEPTFVLRAQDLIAGHAVRAWADVAEKIGVDPEKVRSARRIADAMEQWPRRKVPD